MCANLSPSVCIRRCLHQLTLALTPSPRQGWQSPQEFGGPAVPAGGRKRLFSKQPLLQVQSMPAQPRAAAGCGRCSSNPCIAICWPTPLSTEEPADTRGPGAAGTFGAKTLVLKSSTAQDLQGGGGHLRPQCPSKYRPFLLGCGCGKHGTAHLRPWDRVPSRLFLYRMARSGWPIPSLGLFPPLQRVEVDRPISKGPSRLWISLSCDFRYENQLG